MVVWGLQVDCFFFEYITFEGGISSSTTSERLHNMTYFFPSKNGAALVHRVLSTVDHQYVLFLCSIFFGPRISDIEIFGCHVA